jgi:hypothetical protein
MTMRFLPGLAVAAILSAAAVPSTTVLAQGSLTTKTKQPVACDCTNCSAEHCQPKRVPTETLSLNYTKMEFKPFEGAGKKQFKSGEKTSGE